MTQENFRNTVNQWLDNNFPDELAHQAPDAADAAQLEIWETWRQRLAEAGWGAPTWPKEYGGAALSHDQATMLREEFSKRGALNHIPILANMGVTMVGPTILDYGTEAQKKKHLPATARGEIAWCLGLSEPNAGSDLASLATKAELAGDQFVINGQKIWTTRAHQSQWCGAVVRTDPSATKHNGISFVMLPMDQDGVEPRLIRLISGSSPFCETFFNDARADKADLLGELNDGWAVVKRLLQHERQSQTGTVKRPSIIQQEPLYERAKRYLQMDEQGRLADADLRTRIAENLMQENAHKLTVARIAAEAAGNPKVSAAASILKNSNTIIRQAQAELTLEIMGSQGLYWESSGDNPGEEELAITREWLQGKSASIVGGTFEVQNNIISKNILGLPETTQKNN